MNAQLDLLTHKNCKPDSFEGVIYLLTFGHNREGQFDSRNFVENTKRLQKDIVHILLATPESAPSVTIPAIHGVEKTTALIGRFLRAALGNNSVHPILELNRDQLKWPEHILWPDHILTFFDEDMPEPILDLTRP